MELELVEILYLLLAGTLAFDDDLSCWISVNEPFVNCIEHGTLYLVMKVHRCLALVLLGISVDEPLVLNSIEVTQPQSWHKPPEPAQG